jgi:hypothetical protein
VGRNWVYYSHAFDWGEENGAGNDWDWANPGGDKLLHGSDWWVNYPEFLPKVRKYVDEKAIPQILELITNYHPDILWFDTPHKIPPEENLRIFAAVRKADPNIVINGRIFSGANPDWFRLTDYLNTGDKPGEFSPQDGDWEGIPTTNESFGYNANDHSHKSVAHFIRLLAKAAARGGNILMNMGPRGDGTVDPVDVKIFQGIGVWWKTNGESICGTTRTPLPRQTWTRERAKPAGDAGAPDGRKVDEVSAHEGGAPVRRPALRGTDVLHRRGVVGMVAASHEPRHRQWSTDGSRPALHAGGVPARPTPAPAQRGGGAQWRGGGAVGICASFSAGRGPAGDREDRGRRLNAGLSDVSSRRARRAGWRRRWRCRDDWRQP